MGIVYPPIARAAHVQGEAVVRFSIRADGQTSDVQEVSGPLMLSRSLAGQISNWRFQVPLPITAGGEWTAKVRFELKTGDDDLEDDVSGPPWTPCCGDVITVSAAATQVSATVTNGGGYEIAVGAKANAPVDRCPGKHSKRPEGTGSDDFVELDRRPDYRVRVYRGGRVEWHGNAGLGLEVEGERQYTISPSASDRLFERFKDASFWDACDVGVPPDLDEDGEKDYGRYLVVQLGDGRKAVNVYQGSFSNLDAGPRFAWAVDAAADTHQWRHGEAAIEPLENMRGDLQQPKLGITALMRATNHYNPTTAQWSDAALKFQIAKGSDLEAEDESGWTALMYAAGLHGTCCDDRSVRLLIEAGAHADHTSLHGDTPLMAVAYEGYLSDTLLKAGAKINAHNADGVTVLMLLAQQQNPDVIAEALEAGADASVKDTHGRTALDYLREASCSRAIVPLPIPWITMDDGKPKPCPAITKEYRESEALLTATIKAAR
jgi:TonB family protein